MNTFNSQNLQKEKEKEGKYRQMDIYIHYTVTLSELGMHNGVRCCQVILDGT